MNAKLVWLGKWKNTLQWRHNGCDCVSNSQPHDCLLNRLFRRRWNKTSKLRVIGLCDGNSPVTGDFPSHRAGNAENVTIWRRHHDLTTTCNHCSPLSTRCFIFFNEFTKEMPHTSRVKVTTDGLAHIHWVTIRYISYTLSYNLLYFG